MSEKDYLKNIKKLRELTGVGFKDCKLALDESKGDIEKSVEYLRKKGIAKASKKMSRVAAEGLVLLSEKEGNVSVIEINSETDFVAKNKDFILFCKEISEINETMSTVAEATQQQLQAINEISHNSKEVSEDSKEVARNISDVTLAASEAGQSSQEVLTSATSLGEQTNRMKQCVEKFLTDIKED